MGIGSRGLTFPVKREDGDVPLLPFDNFRIDSALTAAEVHDALAAAVEPRKRFRFARGQCPFEGELGIDSFTLTRIITYRNSFIPRIRGRIITTASGSSVEGTMSLHPAVLWFMSFWFGLLILFGGVIWVSMLAKGVWQPMGLVPLGMFAFGWTLTSGAFTLEAKKARELLTSLLAPGQTPPLTAHIAPTPTR